GDAIGQTASIVREGARDDVLTGLVVREAAALNEQTRLGTLYVSADKTESLILGEFVSVAIVGRDAPQAYRVPAASLTSRDQVWVVKDGRLEERRVEVLGTDDNVAVVRAFDIADGIVAIPPADVRAGLEVNASLERSLVPPGGGNAVVGK
ncbi:MAG: hypothetical protein KC572_14740, partial [Gammaproteobacteria bacterium]|nr:hypothetical protein [Gammaproteobacteria bacterium]